MIKKIFVETFHLALYVLVFLGLVWYLLGIDPKEAYERSIDNVQRTKERVAGFMGDMGQTGHDMNNTANYHLKQPNERIHGKDPYEDAAKEFDRKMLAR